MAFKLKCTFKYYRRRGTSIGEKRQADKSERLIEFTLTGSHLGPYVSKGQIPNTNSQIKLKPESLGITQQDLGVTWDWENFRIQPYLFDLQSDECGDVLQAAKDYVESRIKAKVDTEVSLASGAIVASVASVITQYELVLRSKNKQPIGSPKANVVIVLKYSASTTDGGRVSNRIMELDPNTYEDELRAAFVNGDQIIKIVNESMPK